MPDLATALPAAGRMRLATADGHTTDTRPVIVEPDGQVLGAGFDTEPGRTYTRAHIEGDRIEVTLILDPPERIGRTPAYVFITHVEVDVPEPVVRADGRNQVDLGPYPLPWTWRIFCLVALTVALGEIALTVAILTGAA
ncbi:hypothetical protein [Streptomonospora salina]|uniref:Uncharacterized protein n=1 Tax=Streptomonospora salina TaxID=104205 RepID=A0A841EJ82_9ACTN|nr:hypothetical protein [Streptomonospora salina]MBB6000858.1 hypothetical protein [Streptomonospora salina]